MGKKLHILRYTMVLLLLASCNEPETVVTNYIHTDGTITRKIEMRSSKNNFEPDILPVPFDSTWSVHDSMEISGKNDTTWIKRAEKLFADVDEINRLYSIDSGSNNGVLRKAAFKRKFRWFNTEYSFSEKIDNQMKFGYPIRDFLNDEELQYFYSPDFIKLENSLGPDSLKYMILEDSMDVKTGKWLTKSLVSEWIGEFYGTLQEKGEKGISMESMKSDEDEIVNLMEKYGEKFDSLWENGILLKKIIGEPAALKYKADADSVIDIVSDKILVDFKDYSLRIVMPGRLTGTNGFIDSTSLLFWPVKSDYFMTEPYEMWAESKNPNLWAWVITAIFILFVSTGIILRIIRKG